MDKKEEDQRMKELKDRYIRFDWAIKRLLRQKANFGVLEGWIAAAQPATASAARTGATT